jgi:hypothetical protein
MVNQLKKRRTWVVIGAIVGSCAILALFTNLNSPQNKVSLAMLVEEAASVQKKIDANTHSHKAQELLIDHKLIIDNLISARVKANNCMALKAAEPTLKTGAYNLYTSTDLKAAAKVYYCEFNEAHPDKNKMIFSSDPHYLHKKYADYKNDSGQAVTYSGTPFHLSTLPPTLPDISQATFTRAMAGGDLKFRKNFPSDRLILSFTESGATKYFNVAPIDRAIYTTLATPSVLKAPNSVVLAQVYADRATGKKANVFLKELTSAGWSNWKSIDETPFQATSPPAVAKIGSVTYVAVMNGGFLRLYKRPDGTTTFTQILHAALSPGNRDPVGLGMATFDSRYLALAVYAPTRQLWLTKFNPATEQIPAWTEMGDKKVPKSKPIDPTFPIEVQGSTTAGIDVKGWIKNLNAAWTLSLDLIEKPNPGRCTAKKYVSEAIPTSTNKSYGVACQDYFKNGMAEDRCVPYQDACSIKKYVQKQSDLIISGTQINDPFHHFFSVGKKEGACYPYVPDCTVQKYYQLFPGLKDSTTFSTDPHGHFVHSLISNGVNSLDTCRPVKSKHCTEAEYLRQRPDVAADPYYSTHVGQHFVEKGIKDGMCEPAYPAKCETKPWDCIDFPPMLQLASPRDKDNATQEFARLVALRIHTCGLEKNPDTQCPTGAEGFQCRLDVTKANKIVKACGMIMSKNINQMSRCAGRLIVGKRLPNACRGIQFMSKELPRSKPDMMPTTDPVKQAEQKLYKDWVNKLPYGESVLFKEVAGSWSRIPGRHGSLYAATFLMGRKAKSIDEYHNCGVFGCKKDPVTLEEKLRTCPGYFDIGTLTQDKMANFDACNHACDINKSITGTKQQRQISCYGICSPLMPDLQLMNCLGSCEDKPKNQQDTCTATCEAKYR